MSPCSFCIWLVTCLCFSSFQNSPSLVFLPVLPVWILANWSIYFFTIHTNHELTLKILVIQLLQSMILTTLNANLWTDVFISLMSQGVTVVKLNLVTKASHCKRNYWLSWMSGKSRWFLPSCSTSRVKSQSYFLWFTLVHKGKRKSLWISSCLDCVKIWKRYQKKLKAIICK